MDSPGNLMTEDRSAASVYVPAILAGLAVAIAGGVVWGLIVKSTEYEIGFAAWGIGFLAGMAILFATRGRRGLPLQLIAVVSALLGIAIGKYLSFAWILADVAKEQTGGVVDVPVLSRDTLDLFFDELGVVFDWIDLLWAGLAVFSAWRVLQPESPEPMPSPVEPEEGPRPAPREP
jgi:hypothetical protein